MQKGKVIIIVFGIVLLCAIVFASVTWGPDAFAFFADGEALRAWVESKGLFAPFAMILLVAVQIVIAVLPGEPLELGAGYAFGFWEGTFLCIIGGVVGSLAIVGLVRTLGMRMVQVFFSQEKIDGMKWLHDSARFEALMFALFLIPGTPKDIMTYLAGLTDCPAWRICLITGVGRIPSIVSSTLAAGFAATGNWGATFTVGVLTAVLALAGGIVYAAVARKEKKRAEAARFQHVVDKARSSQVEGDEQRVGISSAAERALSAEVRHDFGASAGRGADASCEASVCSRLRRPRRVPDSF